VSDYATAYQGWAPQARYFQSRLHVVDDVLRECPQGELLDVGCGPGMLVRHLLKTRPGNFRITACDDSPAMVEAVTAQVGHRGDVHTVVANIEDMPFPDASFDVVVATGVLEYVDARRAMREIARVVRPSHLVLVTMLNPLSPYRVFEWVVYWPATRVLGQVERVLGVPRHRRHGARRSGIRAVPQKRLCGVMRDAGLLPEDVVFYDITAWLPPLDQVIRRWTRRWRSHPETTVSRGRSRRLGTAYLVVARRTSEEG
jgi:ubiquinone/menaquinone biosynthesis C-methylase UbiE